jgi:hypothetical protein
MLNAQHSRLILIASGSIRKAQWHEISAGIIRGVAV